MYPNWFGFLCAALALVAFFVTHRGAQGVAPRTRLWLTLAAILLAIPGASFAGYYAHLIPEPAWYVEFRSWRGSEGMLILVGIAGGVAASLMSLIFKALCFFGVALSTIIPFLKPVIGPIPDSAFRDHWDGAVCLQSTPSTCGAASVATALRGHGLTIHERELAREAYSYANGTEVWYLARAVRKRGCEVQWKILSQFDPEVPLPAVAGVLLGNLGHFIAIRSRDGDQFQIGDPIRGDETLSLEELLSRYQFTGFHMSIRPAKPLRRAHTVVSGKGAEQARARCGGFGLLKGPESQ